MRNSIFWQFGIAIPLALAGVTATTSGNYVLAQLTPDNSLGAESSTVTTQQLVDLIRGGAIRDSALFHSFEEFNVGDGRSVFFDLQNNTDILNIFTRVTGGNVSNILGTLGVLQDALNSNDLGNANLFLLNPNGITFGANASLQLNGSFFATTADGFGFDNFTFSASGQEAPPPLLTVSIPSFASFRDAPGDIAVNQGNLTVNQGQGLSLVGGNINIDQGSLTAPGGRIELGGLTTAGTVSINPDFSLVFPNGVAQGDISLANVSNVNVSSNGGGSITINARNLDVSGGSQLSVGINSNSDLQNPKSGDINLNATESITLRGQDTNIFNQVAAGTRGTVGDVLINAPVFNMRDGAEISHGLFGNGNAGLVNVQANTVSLAGQGTTIFSQIAAGGGTVEGILIDTDTLSLTEGGRLVTTTFGLGNASNITISANDVNFDGFSADGTSSGIVATVQSDLEVTEGNVTITADVLNLTNGANINTSTFGVGSAGNTTITANTIIFNGENANGGNSGIQAQVAAGAEGSGGNVNITTNILNVLNGADIAATTSGEGNAGNINITATESISVNGVGSIDNFVSNIGGNTQGNALGNAGDVEITSSLLSLTNGGTILSNTFSQGNGGFITIDSDNITVASGGGIQAAVAQVAEGNAGNIEITTNSLEINSGASITSSTFGQGNAGNILVNANTDDGSGNVTINGSISSGNGNSIFSIVGSDAVGNPGNIIINADSLNLLDGAQLQTTVAGQTEDSTLGEEGNTGNILINVTGDVTLSGEAVDSDGDSFFSGISTQINQGGTGNAGDISINATSLNLLDGGQLRALTNGQGNAGNITINASDAINFDGISNSGFFSGIFTIVQGNGVGNAGDIEVTADSLSLTNTGRISASILGQGDGGDIKINVTDTILIDGIVNGDSSGIFSSVDEDAVGNPGNINIDPEAVIIRDGGIISVSNLGTPLQGNSTSEEAIGNISITSDNLTLDDGNIVANTTSTDGGNITLTIADLILLRNGNGDPLISANAGQPNTEDPSGIEGGNITIDTTFLVAIPGEDSDITANSQEGPGGVITINAEGVFGIQFQPDTTDGNDITANSAVDPSLDGQVIFNNPQTNPQQENIEPPEDVTDETDVVAQNACSIGIGSQLANTGRSGLPQIPGFTIRNDAVNVDLVDEVLPVPPSEAIKPHHRTTVTFTDSNGEEFKPAMGAVLLPNGMVQFVDYNPAEVYRDMYASAGCSS